jgi:DNA-binding CsgD family transcriptional regulator
VKEEAMGKISEIMKNRSLPGTLIFDLHRKLLFFNQEASAMIPGLLPGLGKGKRVKATQSIFELYDALKEGGEEKGLENKETFKSRVFQHNPGPPYLMRAFFIHHPSEKKPAHIMITIEKIIEGHDFDFEKARSQFGLSRREMEVLRLICQGQANKEISKELFISEYTVKDHTKKILKKMGVNSRNQIISSLR